MCKALFWHWECHKMRPLAYIPGQCISNLCHLNYPGILPNSRTGLRGSGVSPSTCISNKLLGDSDATSPYSLQKGSRLSSGSQPWLPTWKSPGKFYKIPTPVLLPQSSDLIVLECIRIVKNKKQKLPW